MKHDEASQAAEAIMKPAISELSKRQERQKRWKVLDRKPFVSLAPAAVAATTTAGLMSFLSLAPVYAAVAGLWLGWTIGTLLSGRN